MSIEKFTYRIPRYSVAIPVRLTVGSATVSGRCHQISANGMCLDLDQPLSPDYAGTAWLIHGNIEIEVPIMFAHAGSGHNGVKFAFASDQQRLEIARLIQLLTGQARDLAVDKP